MNQEVLKALSLVCRHYEGDPRIKSLQDLIIEAHTDAPKWRYLILPSTKTSACWGTNSPIAALDWSEPCSRYRVLDVVTGIWLADDTTVPPAPDFATWTGK